jgi:hypothetical protein
LPSEKALASSNSSALNASESMMATTTIGGSTNTTTNATGAISENVTSRLENATRPLENATIALTNATIALQDVISNLSAAARAPQPPPLPITTTNATAVNTTTVINSIFDSNLPAVFIIVISLIIIIPLVLDMVLAYWKKPKGSSTDKENDRIVGMPGLYRSLMTFGIIVLVGTVIFYLLALITLNINNSTSPVLQSLVDVLKSLGTILGTALATIIVFYFGTRGTEAAVEKAAAAMAAKSAGEKAPPKVLNTIPADGATEVPVTSLISATFSEPMNSLTINENTFTVRKADVPTPIAGTISLSPDGKTAIFDPTPDLDPNNIKYTAEINEGAKDLAGNALVSAKRWSFTTA